MNKIALFLAGCVAGAVGTLVVSDLRSEDSRLKKLPQKWEKLNSVLETKEEEEEPVELEAAK